MKMKKGRPLSKVNLHKPSRAGARAFKLPVPIQRRMAVMRPKPESEFAIRVFHRAGRKRRTPRYLLRCGCCNASLEIHYNEESLEINGVNGSLENWREILLPLLEINQPRRKQIFMLGYSARR